MIRKALVVLVLVGFAIIFDSCYCHTYKETYHFDSQNAYEFIPLISDTVLFKNDEGNIHSYTMVNSVNEYYDVLCENCCSKFSANEFERRRILYDSDQLTFKLTFQAVSEGDEDNFSVYYQSKLPLNILYYNEQYNFLENASLKSILDHTNPLINHVDSMSLNSKMYNDVYKLSYNLNTTKYYLKDIYYTPSQGMVSYTVSDGKNYYIVD